MHRIPTLLAAVAVASLANVAVAVPHAYYNPADGTLRIWNNTGVPLAVVNIKSPSGKLKGVPLAVPGTTMDLGDQPYFVVYFNFPATDSTWNTSTWVNVGSLVQGGGAGLDLSVTYFSTFAPGQTEQPMNSIFPEPTAATMCGLGLAAITAVNRRRRSHR